MLLHFMGHSCQNHRSSLATRAEVTKDLYDTLFNSLVVKDLSLEVICADALRQDVWLKSLCLVMVL